MRKLLAVVVIAAAAYGGYWFVGASAVEQGLRGWLAEQSARGWSVAYDDLSTRGFPSRFDTTITDLRLRDPATGYGWEAPFFQILALSYRPAQIIAAFPNSQVVATPRQEIAVTSERMRASATFAASTPLALDRSTLVANTVTLTGAGWSAAMDQLRLATRRAIGLQHGHDVDLVALALRPAEDLRARLDPDGDLPEALDTVTLDATLGFDAPLDRHALSETRPHLTDIDLTEARIAWGSLGLRLSGRITVDRSGMPGGQLTLTARDWQRLVDLAVNAGLIPPGGADTARAMVRMLAGQDSASDTLEVPITFVDGRVAIGRIDLGPAPRLRL